MRHGTEGWRCLESSMRALQQLVEGGGPVLSGAFTPELRELLFRRVSLGGPRLAGERVHGAPAPALALALAPAPAPGRPLLPALATPCRPGALLRTRGFPVPFIKDTAAGR
jgi:hypothetical protein